MDRGTVKHLGDFVGYREKSVRIPHTLWETVESLWDARGKSVGYSEIVYTVRYRGKSVG